MNNFQEIEPRDTIPTPVKEQIKEQTMSNLSTLKFLMDMVDLFVVNGTFTLAQSFAPGSQAPRKPPAPASNGERNSD